MTSDPHLLISLSLPNVSERIRPAGQVPGVPLFKWRLQWWFLGVCDPCHQQSWLDSLHTLVAERKWIWRPQEALRLKTVLLLLLFSSNWNLRRGCWKQSFGSTLIESISEALLGSQELCLFVSIRSSFTEGFQHPSGSSLHRINPRPARSIHLSPEPHLRSELTAVVLLTGTFYFSDTLISKLRLQEQCGMPELTLWATFSWLHSHPCLTVSSLTLNWNLTSVILWLSTFLLHLFIFFLPAILLIQALSVHLCPIQPAFWRCRTQKLSASEQQQWSLGKFLKYLREISIPS